MTDILRNERRLSLHVPEPVARPGGAPDFSGLNLAPAGETRRPDIDAPASTLGDMVVGLVRVLDEGGNAHGPWNPRLSAELMLRGLRAMVTTRAYDERMVRVQRQGKTSFYMKSTGEEAVAVAAAVALDREDMCFPTYRQQGLLVARDWPLREMMNQVYSNTGDRLKGRQMPVFYSSREAGFFSISGNLCTQYSQAVGWAMGSAASNDTRIAAAWVGDGATAEGDFHHALLFASVYRAPVILNIVNNQWAISSFAGFAGGEASTFAARGLAYGLPSIRVDGNDFLAVHAATTWAAERARMNLGATVLEMVTYRADAHSTSDDPTRYRPKDEAQGWPLGDPIARLRQHLTLAGSLDDAAFAAMEEQARLHVLVEGKASEALGTLHSGPRLDPATLFEGVFKEMPAHLARQQEEMSSFT